MTTKTKGSHSKFWALLKQMEGYSEAYKEVIKESWVSDYSGGKYTSLSGFHAARPFDYKRMLDALEKNIKEGKKSDKDRQNAQRRKLLALVYTFCKHKKYACTPQQALKIACKACAVVRLNDASEQKVIAAIKRFEKNEADAWVDSVLKNITN